ncbi:electron transport complex subunit RsxC [Enterococcus olivae]
MKKKLIGGISLSPPLKALKEKLKIHQQEVHSFEPNMVFIPLVQHIGTPAEPIVAIGDQVKQGQVIAETDAFVSAKIHASVSGKVLDITDWPDAGNQTTQAIIIENDFNYANDFRSTSFAWQQADNSFIKQKIQQAGIAGKGGATFPTHVKFAIKDSQSIDTLVLNGSECEPFLRSDALLMQNNAEKIIEGARIARKLLNDPAIVISIEDDKPLSIAAMKEAASPYSFIRVEEVPTVYPVGGEKQLVELLLDREVPIGKLTADVGVVLMNVATTFALYEAVCWDKPLIDRYTTVTGDVGEPQVVRSPIGTLAGELIDFAGRFQGAPSKVIMGGPMMGRTVNTLRVPTTKSTNGILVFNEENDWLFTENPCIRCNKCVEACPMRLMPMSIDQYFRAGDFDKCEELLADACINCGACTFVCPARRNLAATISDAKNKVIALKKEAAQHA